VAVTETSNDRWISGSATAIMVEFSGASVIPIATAGSSQRLTSAVSVV